MKLSKLATVIASSSAVMACFDSSDSDSQSAESKLLESNAQIAYAVYSDSVTTAQALQVALTTFKDTPSADNLVAAKKAWLVAREPYGQSEAFRFQGGPIDFDSSIDDANSFITEDGPEGALNAWPLGEGLIDYVKIDTADFNDGQPAVPGNGAGINGGGAVNGADQTQNIIATTTITIDADLLDLGETDAGDGADVLSGYHAIEFLLWGQDLNATGNGTDGTDRTEADKVGVFTPGGGQRPLSDFESSAANDTADRRHQYLAVAATKLIADLQKMQTAWAPNASNYRSGFVDTSNSTATTQRIAKIVEAMGTMAYGELAGERIQVAYSGNSQEDEHSCFSDNTHRDIWLNAEGVANLYYGDYAGYDSTLNGEDDTATNSVKGYGFDDYLNDKGFSQLSTDISTALSTTATEYTKIDTAARKNDQPFDVLIMDANRNDTNPVNTTINALKAQSNGFIEMAEKLGLGDIADAVNGSTEAFD